MALVVFAGKGSQAVVGSVPPPVPEPLHWLTVIGVTAGGVIDDGTVMLLMMSTLQVTVPPPPLPEPLHWSTEVVSWSEGVVVVVHGRAALAAPWHSLVVTVELVVPVPRSMLLVMVVSQATACPPTLSVPLHWLTATPGAAAAATIGAGAAAVATNGRAADSAASDEALTGLVADGELVGLATLGATVGVATTTGAARTSPVTAGVAAAARVGSTIGSGLRATTGGLGSGATVAATALVGVGTASTGVDATGGAATVAAMGAGAAAAAGTGAGAGVRGSAVTAGGEATAAGTGMAAVTGEGKLAMRVSGATGDRPVAGGVAIEAGSAAMVAVEVGAA